MKKYFHKRFELKKKAEDFRKVDLNCESKTIAELNSYLKDLTGIAGSKLFEESRKKSTRKNFHKLTEKEVNKVMLYQKINEINLDIETPKINLLKNKDLKLKLNKNKEKFENKIKNNEIEKKFEDKIKICNNKKIEEKNNVVLFKNPEINKFIKNNSKKIIEKFTSQIVKNPQRKNLKQVANINKKNLTPKNLISCEREKSESKFTEKSMKTERNFKKEIIKILQIDCDKTKNKKFSSKKNSKSSNISVEKKKSKNLSLLNNEIANVRTMNLDENLNNLKKNLPNFNESKIKKLKKNKRSSSIKRFNRNYIK